MGDVAKQVRRCIEEVEGRKFQRGPASGTKKRDTPDSFKSARQL